MKHWVYGLRFVLSFRLEVRNWVSKIPEIICGNSWFWKHSMYAKISKLLSAKPSQKKSEAQNKDTNIRRGVYVTI